MKRRSDVVSGIVLGVCLFAGVGLAEAQGRRGGGPGGEEAPAPPGSYAMTIAGHVVENLDRTIDFYRQVFGFLPFQPPTRPQMNQAMEKLVNTPGARYRQVTMRMPNSGLLLRFIEFSTIEKTPQRPRSITDPGQSHLRFDVSDVEAVVANLQRMNAQFVAPATAQAARTATTPILVRDPDGFLIEVAKGIGSQGSNVGLGASPVLNSRVVLTADTTEGKFAFYQGILGAPITAGSQWQRQPLGATAGEVRESISGDIGGPGRVIEVREYRNQPNKTPYKPRIQDPGATMLSFIVRNLAEVQKQVQAANLPILTVEGKPIELAHMQPQRIVVQDPDGVFVELIQE